VFSRWPIRNKLLLGLALVSAIVLLLSWGGIHGLYAYRSLVKTLGRRAYELPLAGELSQRVSDLRVALAESQLSAAQPFPSAGDPSPVARLAHEEFELRLSQVEHTLRHYRHQLADNPERDILISDSRREAETVRELEATLARIRDEQRDQTWLPDGLRHAELRGDLEQLQVLAGQLPSYLHASIRQFGDDARSQYRTLIILSWITSVTTAVVFALFIRLMYSWVFRPLRVLVKGSRRVAAGEFDYRIRLETNDEMSELASAMNDMTARFQAIRDDLDGQVQERTRQVIRNEQLASVGFLAAGVAHEINNPLASIAMCAESLEGRFDEILAARPADEDRVVRQYLRMIQDEAFRCKGITERLLDFSRLGDVKRQATDLRELVENVVEMLRHLGSYQGKHLELAPGAAVWVSVNAQEIKQVVLNLLTNGLESLDSGGVVRIALTQSRGKAVLTVEDDGCGMSPEVQQHLFEPFFTRRRGGQGTGLGLSISYRIIADHEGRIEVHSDGPGRGARFRVVLPTAAAEKEIDHRHQAA
jgi:two-component system, NtrC family, sensor kinase